MDVGLEQLQYPIGKFHYGDGGQSAGDRKQRIAEIAATPAELRRAVEGLSDEQLDTPYREGGWTLRQVAHHVADASMNAFNRTKLALTEKNPTVKPFEEQDWAMLADARLPVEPSLRMLEGIHERWDSVLRSLSEEAFASPFLHPATGQQTLDRLVAHFAWHGRHHIAHITALRKRMGW